MSMIKQLLALAGAACLLSPSLSAQGSFSDDFDRAAGTDLGFDWTEAVGDWEIFDNVARSVETDTTLEKLLVHDALLIDRAFVIEADLNWVPVQNQWNGIVWNLSGTDTYYLIRMRADSGRLQVIKRIDGANISVPVDTGNGAMTIEEGIFYRISIRGDGNGNFWWSVSNGEEVLGDGSFSDEEPLSAGSSGIYAGREAIEVDRFSAETFDLSVEAPDLGIETAVEIFFTTTAGFYYQIESSSDMGEWTAESDVIEGDGSEVSRLFSTREGDRQFFRVQTSEERL